MAIYTETDRYKVETTRNGLLVVITRKHDGVDVHLQGEAAAELLDLIDELDDCWMPDLAKFREFFDHSMSQYDDVMTKRQDD